MNPTPPLHAWIFNNASIAGLLSASPPVLWKDPPPGIIVELGEAPALALAGDLETPPGFPGVAGLLGTMATPADLVVRLPDVPAPVLLAPSAAPGLPAVAAALSRLAGDTRVPGMRLLLVSMEYAPRMLHLLSGCSQVGIAYDCSVPPSAELERLVALLAEEGLPNLPSWAGMLAYFGADHQATASERATLEALLQGIPGARLLHNNLPQPALA